MDQWLQGPEDGLTGELAKLALNSLGVVLHFGPVTELRKRGLTQMLSSFSGYGPFNIVVIFSSGDVSHVEDDTADIDFWWPAGFCDKTSLLSMVEDLKANQDHRIVRMMTLQNKSLACVLALSSLCGDVGVVGRLLSTQHPAVMSAVATNRRAFDYACAGGNLDIVRRFLALEGSLRVDVHAGNEAAFQAACAQGRLLVVHELLSLTDDRRIDVHAEDEGALREACSHGWLEVVQVLLSLDGDRTVDVHSGGEAAFVAACRQGKTAVVQALLSLEGERRVDVHAQNDAAFRIACAQGRLDAVRMLLALEGERRVQARSALDGAFVAACMSNHADIVREMLLLDGDRQLDLTHHATNILQQASLAGHTDVVLELLRLTGKRAVHTFIDSTCLNRALIGRHWRTMEVLLGATAQEVHSHTLVAHALTQGFRFVPLCAHLADLLAQASRSSLHAPRAQRVRLQVLLHVLRSVACTPTVISSLGYHKPAGALLWYCALCAVLSAAQSRNIGAFIVAGQQQTSDEAEFLQKVRMDAVWRGVHVGTQVVIGEPGVDCIQESGGGLHSALGLPAAGMLGRMGRRQAVLHRTGLLQARRATTHAASP